VHMVWCICDQCIPGNLCCESLWC